MGTPQIPQRQQDALPVQTIAQATGADFVQLGVGVSKFFSPAVLGVNGISRQAFVNGATTHFAVLSNFLDLRGCNRFALLVQRTTDDASIAPGATPHSPVMQFRMSVGVVPPFAINPPGTSIYLAEAIVGPGGTFPNMNTGTPQVYLSTWSTDEITGPAGVVGCQGYDVRVGITWGVNDPDGSGTVHERFTMQLWAQT